MSFPQIPWDSPSRYGRAGMAARMLIKRLTRPVTIRVEQELSDLRAMHSETFAQSTGTRTELDRLTGQLAALDQEVTRNREFATAADRVLDNLLLSDLSEGERHRRVHQEGAARAICSMATGEYRGLLSRTAISFERYAERWGWDLILSTEELSSGRPAPWGKIPLLRELMDEYEWLLWVDADVALVDLEADITREIRDGKDLYLVERRGTQYTANSGVMLIRSSSWSRAFMEEVWKLGEISRDHRRWDAAILTLLGYGLAPARLVQPTPWLERVQFLDVRFNSVETHRADPPAFVHRAFYDVDTRSRQVTGDLSCVLGAAHPLTAGWDRPARPIRGVTDVRRREELPLLLNALGLTGVGAEIGARKGHFSEHVLTHWKGERLISADRWVAAPADEYVDISKVTQDEHDANHAETARRLARFGDRSTIWRRDSAGAGALLRPDSLDFVYLDAHHDEGSVREDLETWWPIVRPGGLLCGRDYLDGELQAGVFGVRTAVDSFFAQLGQPVHSTTDDAPWPTWIVVKPAAP